LVSKSKTEEQFSGFNFAYNNLDRLGEYEKEEQNNKENLDIHWARVYEEWPFTFWHLLVVF
jgi:hypothetical protein